MESFKSNNRIIAKNTMFLYIRMMFTMLVALFTSRIIFQKLGIDDFGIYQTVGGIVGFLSFLNGALSTGSSRFLTFELGSGDSEKLKKTFSSVLTVHIILAIVIAVFAEAIGLWFIYHKLVIPVQRLDAAVFAFHLSVLASLLSITQIPYNASIIAHEKMGVYAYVSIYEVITKLAICFLIGLGGWDKLKFYAILIFLVQTSILIFYRFYCSSHFKETKYEPIFDKTILKPILSFSGWSLFANSAIALSNEGILLLLNMFFSPAIVASRAISIQVNMAANQFVQNFRTAANPQIVKKYAAHEFEESKHLLLESTKLSYYLMFAISLPVCLLAKPLLRMWLGQIPPYADIFLQLIIIQSLFSVFDTSFYTALYAKGRLKENALISPLLVFIAFPIVYFLLKMGYSPVVLSWAYLFVYVLLGLLIKPILIIKVVNYTWSDIYSVFSPCLLVTVIASVLAIILHKIMNDESFLQFIFQAITIVIIVCITTFVFGLNKSMKHKIKSFLFIKLRLLAK